nr:ribonuclease H-like domain-containing protein [Tanacetum cinerariifolium]
MTNVIDISELNITVSHPNGTTVEIRKVRNLKLTNNIVLFDVLVIPEYCVSLLSINKLVRDSKLHVGFDEYDYIIQDLKKENILGTGSEAGGLYVFNIKFEKHFDDFQTDSQALSPNDDEGEPSGRNIGLKSNSDDTAREQSSDNDQESMYVGEEDFSEGNNFEILSQHMYAPLQSYMDLSLRVLRYLKGTLGLGINFEKSKHMSLKATLFKSSAEAKYRSMAAATCKLMWIVNILKDLKVTNLLPVKLFCDNSASIEIAANHVQSMNEEMHALYENNTWDLVELPRNKRAIRSKWVYKTKPKSTGEIDIYKARLVAKGFNQKEGIDYEETFSTVVKMGTIRCLISLAVQNGWCLFQLDVNNAFLHGHLNEDVYMLPPPRFFDKNKTRVYKLKKSLYDLKQAPRQWNNRLSKALIKIGFKQSRHDHSLYTKEYGGVFIALLVYVDDMILTSNNIDEINNVKKFLSSKFKIKDLDELKYILGIEACKLVSTPLPKNIILAHKEKEGDKFLKNVTRYQRLSHMDLGLRVLSYLKGTTGPGIDFEKTEHMSLKATLSKSSAEAEYKLMTAATCELMWIVNILKDFKVTNLLLVELFCDNSAAIQIAANHAALCGKTFVELSFPDKDQCGTKLKQKCCRNDPYQGGKVQRKFLHRETACIFTKVRTKRAI